MQIFSDYNTSVYIYIQQQYMSNIHGVNDLPNPNRQPRRSNQLHNQQTSLSMLGITQLDLQIMGTQISQNRVPFINIMSQNVQPLQQTIPYTLKLVWCPAFNILSFSTFVLIAIWVLYIVTLSKGIDTMHYMVLAPTAQTLRQFGACNYQLLKDGEVWRLIVAAFLHFDLLQIFMSTISILFFVTQLQQCYNPLSIGLLMIVSAISANITTAVFGDIVSLTVGAGSMVYGILGGFYSYITINWSSLYLIRQQLLCIFSMMTFFAMLFSIGGIYGFANFMGGFIGGYVCGLAVFKPIRERSWVYVGVGVAGLVVYWLMMFLIFYLAV